MDHDHDKDEASRYDVYHERQTTRERLPAIEWLSAITTKNLNGISHRADNYVYRGHVGRCEPAAGPTPIPGWGTIYNPAAPAAPSLNLRIDDISSINILAVRYASSPAADDL